MPLSIDSRDTGTERGPTSRAIIRALTVSEYSFISLHRFSPQDQVDSASGCREEAATILTEGVSGIASIAQSM